jgi:diguanylate cyclase (GGDEF)-like protein
MEATERPSPATAPLLVILLGLSVAYFTYSTTSRVEGSQKQALFVDRARGYAQRLHDCLDVQADLLWFLTLVCARDQGIDAQGIEWFVSRPLLTDPRFAALRTIAWVERVPPGGLDAYEVERRQQLGDPTFQVHGRDGHPVDRTGPHDVVDEVFPNARYSLIHGLDLSSDALLRATLEEATLVREPRMSRPVSLLTEEPKAGTRGVLAVFPVIADARGGASTGAPGRVIGHVVGMFSLKALLEQTVELHGGEDALPRVNIVLRDREQVLESVGPAAEPVGEGVPDSFEMMGHLWELTVAPAQPQALTVEELLARPSSLLTASVCIMMLLFAWIAWTLNRQKWVVQQRVLQQTAEQRERNVMLEGKERELHEANRRLLEMSNTDPLTGILNRRAFEVQVDKERERSLRTGVPFGLLIFDVDKFKDFNDRYGHSAGDEVLRRVSGIISAEARRIDTVARYGGEEFVVLATGTDAAGLLALGERIRGRIQEAGIDDATSPKGVVTVSGGGSLSNAALGHDPKTAFEIADRCLYEAKSTGRNRVTMVM